MSNLTDRISYLKGLAEGMKLNTEKDSNRLILGILDVLGDIGNGMEALAEGVDALDQYVESIDDDLSDLEGAVFGDEDEDEDEDMDDEDEIISYECPHCGYEMQFDAEDVDFNEDTLCPQCNKPIFPETTE